MKFFVFVLELIFCAFMMRVLLLFWWQNVDITFDYAPRLIDFVIFLVIAVFPNVVDNARECGLHFVEFGECCMINYWN